MGTGESAAVCPMWSDEAKQRSVELLIHDRSRNWRVIDLNKAERKSETKERNRG